MKHQPVTIMSRLLVPLLFCLAASAGAETPDLPYVEIQHARDFSRLAQDAHRQDRLIMLEIAGSDCGYCESLEEDYIKPMLRSGDYGHVIIRKLDRDAGSSIIDFSGRQTPAGAFAYRYKVSLTPTLLFLDANGREVAERIIGYNTPELFGGYLDAAIEAGMRKISPR